jgi:subtilisin family serine protease
MNKKLFYLATMVVIFGMVFSNTLPTQAQNSVAWSGAWQMGPSMDAAALWGGPAGDGAARFSGAYYNGFVYFLGVRDFDNNTYGSIFKFDPATKTFSTTGVSMPTPVSNYLISIIPDDGQGHGAGLYVLGGRKSDATQYNMIQVYYPTGNTVATITTDPVPGTARNIGGQAVVNGKIYIFGGFDGANMYAESYVYDPAAAAGSRWSNLSCNLPSARSYVSAAAIDSKVYAMGGDEYDGTSLVPIAQTLVFDTTSPGSCWSDAAMPDLPSANGDAPAVYVSHADNAYMGGASGAIFIIGGYWPSPGPYRWVFRYDVAGNTWDQFQQLVVPDPATGRRNQAAVFVPNSGLNGIGTGVPGIWTFGGYDGSAANAMTATTEFFSVTNTAALLLPDQLDVVGNPGETAVHTFSLVNQSGADQVFDLSATPDQPTWTVDLPATLAVGNSLTGTFAMNVTIPAGASCLTTDHITVTATAQGAPSVSDSQVVTVRPVCTLSGTITDANTGLPLQNAYVWIQTDPDGLTGDYFDAYTDASGQYHMVNVKPGVYLWGVDRQYYQPSFLPTGWPGGAVSVTIPNAAGPISVALKASDVQWSPTDTLTATVVAGSTAKTPLILSNTTGTGPLHFSTSILDAAQPVPPPAMAEGVPGLPRLDPQITSDMASSTDGTADYVVLLTHKADLSQAYTIQDWNERGQYVYDTLTQYANRTQTGLRRYLDAMGASYTPLYIVNGIIVHAGNSTLATELLARPDVLQLVGNHAIAVDTATFNVRNQPFAVQQPETVGWNITKTNAPQVWSTYSDKGAGITVAEIDTGTQWDHPALKTHYRGWVNGLADHNYNWFDPYNQSTLVPHDVNGHGTHVMGTMVGDDGNPGTNQIGMAPAAKWITCKGGDDVSGSLLTHELLVCAQWIIAPTDLAGNNADATKRPDVVNNSWGGGPNDYWYTDAVSAWKAAGIFPQFANGNAGPSCSTAHSPGDYWNTFAAGATTSTNAIASFSSRGPAVTTGILKPDISAPGAGIRSSVPGNSYALYDGTSMASPHVAGAVALLWSAAPELKGQIDLTAWILEQSATTLLTNEGCGGDTPTAHPNNTFGWGLLNIKAAVDLAKQDPAPTPGWVGVWPTAGGTVLAGSSVELQVTFAPPAGTTLGLHTYTLWLVSDDPYHPDVRLPIEVTVVNELKFYLPGVLKVP